MSSKFVEFIKGLNPFKKKEDIFYPHEFGLIVPSSAASIEGRNDKYNKIVIRYLNGKPIEPPMPYSKAYVDALEVVEGIPVIEAELDDDEYVEIDTYGDFGVLELERVKV